MTGVVLALMMASISQPEHVIPPGVLAGWFIASGLAAFMDTLIAVSALTRRR